MMMKELTKPTDFLLPTFLFIGLPVWIYLTGDFSRRTTLKESISILVIIAFYLMVAQFFLNRSTNFILSGFTKRTVLTVHKILGYSLVCVLLLHPLLIVVPRYFESGIGPMEAFVTIITTLDSLGVVIGILAWSLLLTLGVTSLFRNILPLSYAAWRKLHGILAIFFMAAASWHALDLGRHINQTMTLYMMLVVLGGVFFFLKNSLFKARMNKRLI
jgi:predicted ferric reductase